MSNSKHYPPVFDGHNDVLAKLEGQGAAGRQAFIEGNNAHIDLPKAKQGNFAGGFFAIWIPSTRKKGGGLPNMTSDTYDIPLPDPVSQVDAIHSAMSQASTLVRLQAEGALRICTSVAQIEQCITDNIMAAIMHIEGAEAIDENFDTLEVFYQAGLRSLGPVWSRTTAFGHGVPFRFPATPDIGPGLTAKGKELVAHCNRLGIMLDLSHMNAAGFWDVAKLSNAPLVATHSNAHALSTHPRNLTDDQLDAIKDSNGMVGLNFATAFLRSDGKMRGDTGIDIMVNHLDYLLEHLGEDHVGLGSDFDGAGMPNDLSNAAKLPNLINEMRDRGYADQLITKICHKNWLRVLDLTWST